eukprot:c7553_g1_i1.p1 GENE.c7553_g1_i1~~c7553_g1_i1.p1  ORF type:complete len:259 (+),score=61.23 c7553_g1_i1:1-777(+)
MLRHKRQEQAVSSEWTDVWNNFARMLATNIYLTTLCLDRNIIPEGPLNEILTSLAHVPGGSNLTVLSLEGMGMGREDSPLMKRVGDFLRLSRKLRVLNLKGNHIADASLVLLTNGIVDARDGCQLEVLLLDDNDLGDRGMHYIAQALPRSLLNTISLFGNPIGDAGIVELTRAVGAKASMKTLYLGNNAYGKRGAKAVDDMYASSPQLRCEAVGLFSSSVAAMLHEQQMKEAGTNDSAAHAVVADADLVHDRRNCSLA